jgi:hypothetical protein
MTSEIEVAWAAGFFDGEGCVSAKRAGRRYNLMIAVTQIDLRPLLKMRRLFGGFICAHPARKEGWAKWYQWVASACQAAQALKAMLPYLMVKREVAELGLALQRSKRSPGHHIAQCEADQQRWYAEAIKAQNALRPDQDEAGLPAKPTSSQLRLVI